ncbi:hypothetical protein FRACYDRAFT_249990 [Fragilariopsis cylindrus CCMP1102]|uniref:DDE Tnp4 domain-containing protein n=1 Tax=Fragilariopsis cylindrus CCMP1102 TaxID=635003 RepID=A0A1E7EQF4_9STRA|nr:hypothetical protein FRACYDRAFT_249990 [Fragilariopsis cylindrus CCMP1102]|eukprot:OEU08202.1 hypothetical protein FRACYDRAFT_249990 [Fragilariopsis cylindrus CCMP1102]
MILTADGIELWAQQTLRWPVSRKWSSETNMRFRSVFGAGSIVVADIWNRIEADGEILKGGEPKHLLWALVLLKVYQSDEVHCALVGWPSVPTFRKWAWYFIERINDLKDNIIKVEYRFNDLDDIVTTNCFMSSDCVDCPVFESWPWSKRMFSKKFNGPGVKYDVGVCIKTGHIVWLDGPFVASASESTIFKNGLGQHICEDEKVEVDSGPKGDSRLVQPHVGNDSKERKQKSVVRGRQEGVNGRMKVYSVLTNHFHHMKDGRENMMNAHGLCFKAVAVITQLKISTGEPIFKDEVEYDVSYF